MRIVQQFIFVSVFGFNHFRNVYLGGIGHVLVSILVQGEICVFDPIVPTDFDCVKILLVQRWQLVQYLAPFVDGCVSENGFWPLAALNFAAFALW